MIVPWLDASDRSQATSHSCQHLEHMSRLMPDLGVCEAKRSQTGRRVCLVS